MHTKLAKNVCFIIFKGDIWPPIHNIVVVTSPIGDQAPPAFVAITTKEAYQIRSSRLWINFLNNEIKTIVAVRLSITEDSKKQHDKYGSHYYLTDNSTAENYLH